MPVVLWPRVSALINQIIVRIINMPDIREKIISQGATPVGNSPAEFANFVRHEIVKWTKV